MLLLRYKYAYKELNGIRGAGSEVSAGGSGIARAGAAVGGDLECGAGGSARAAVGVDLECGTGGSARAGPGRGYRRGIRVWDG
ncbi:hypothetical protein ASD40_13385 [Paenibacillus sp. Root444D2]|nr:hypothetical protein ASD40_13385 [Paenibacillus sp. Root444D2]KRE48703.1 hypothetical protein ASG85_26445 [Paenibacillus sp. Soil724D2]